MLIPNFKQSTEMMKLSYIPYTLLFRHPFRIAHGMRTSTPVMIIRLEHEGITGYGEASMPPYLGESHETVKSFLEKAKPIIEKHADPLSFRKLLCEIDLLAENNTAAKAAIDIALHDLSGKILNQPCWKIFGADASRAVTSSFTLGIDNPEVLRVKVDEAKEFRILKVKLNGINDKEVIESIRSVTDKPIGVDVNQGWKNREEAISMITWLAERNVILIEQPLLKTNLDDMYWLKQRSSLPLFADESVQRYTDIDMIYECFDGINIKLMKCTGLAEAKRMITRAREHKLQVLLGCMSETSCAISAAAQLASLCDKADLDGALLVNNDPFKGIEFKNGFVCLSEQPGIGAFPKEGENLFARIA